MIVRAFVPADLTQLIELTVETFRPSFEESFRPLMGEVVFGIQHGNWRDDYRREVPELHDPGQHKYVAVAESNGRITGYVGWRVEPARAYGSITLLAVAADHRRGRAGAALCEHAFGEMRGLGARMVEIGTGGDAFHAPARALYESLGCVKVPTAVYFREL
ncbi:GNAT family N-acetyltransferase [Streptomyces sp. NBC_01465]|uniref:GNAT family N-acetyltransferase n=1 Tax=Streptomyces sp. NBC_01465 TaxID=2903878 RepID=UPI002E377B87|nr:GNAT family N-acetyltransferase [Streptomyces sp. NBC_01465]